MTKILLPVMEFVKKYWMYIVGVLGVIILYRKFFVGIVKNVVTTYDIVGTSISNQQALVYAENLFDAMKDVGTDEDVLKQVLSVLSQNPADVKAVYNAFGYREYALFGSPVYFWMPSSKVNLKQWIKNETSGTLHDSWMSLFNAAGII